MDSVVGWYLGSEIAGFTHSSKTCWSGGFPIIMWNSETFATTSRGRKDRDQQKPDRKKISNLFQTRPWRKLPSCSKKKTVLPHPDLLVSWWQSRQAGRQASKQNVQSAEIYLCAFSNLQNFLAKMQIGFLRIGCTSFINISTLQNFLAKMQIGCLRIGCTSFINISNLLNFLAKMQIGCLPIGCTVS